MKKESVAEMVYNITNENIKLKSALSGIRDRFVELIESGDCGHFSPNDEPSILIADELLKETE